ncbi:unnamed protein product [Discosporangium mesarthrocarpum]
MRALLLSSVLLGLGLYTEVLPRVGGFSRGAVTSPIGLHCYALSPGTSQPNRVRSSPVQHRGNDREYRRYVHTVDYDAPGLSEGSRDIVDGGLPWTATVELPKADVPKDLPEPATWLFPAEILSGSTSAVDAGAPIVSTAAPPAARLPLKPEKQGLKANPFSVPDNKYNDTWFDKLWIGLFCSRLSAAVIEGEAPEVAELTPSPPSPGSLEAALAAAAAGGRKSARGGETSCGTRQKEKMGVKQLSAAKSHGPSYEEYVSLALRLQNGSPEHQREVVQSVLRSIFPPWFPALYRFLFPVGKFSSEVNAFMCPPLVTWLVGKSELVEGEVEIEAPGGQGVLKEVWQNTVKVERCRFLEASRCKGACMNLCKVPTETFFQEDMGMPFRMTPNFEDLSCEFSFGQAALPMDQDPLMKEVCMQPEQKLLGGDGQVNERMNALAIGDRKMLLA